MADETAEIDRILANYAAAATSAFIFLGLPLLLFWDLKIGAIPYVYLWLVFGASAYLLHRLPSRGVNGRRELALAALTVVFTPLVAFPLSFLLGLRKMA